MVERMKAFGLFGAVIDPQWGGLGLAASTYAKIVQLISRITSYNVCYTKLLRVQDGLRRMVTEQEDVYYYITVMNENYTHPAMPEGAEEGIVITSYSIHYTKLYEP